MPAMPTRSPPAVVPLPPLTTGAPSRGPISAPSHSTGWRLGTPPQKGPTGVRRMDGRPDRRSDGARVDGLLRRVGRRQRDDPLLAQGPPRPDDAPEQAPADHR